MATVFGALNRFISRLDPESPSQSSRTSQSASGFQVLRNKNPDIAIEPWYDFIIGINGRRIDNPSPSLFAAEVRNCAGSTVSLTLWNAKGSLLRTLSIPVPTPSPTLGLTLQHTPLSSTEDVWHILDVIPSSPADAAGLLPYSDYIVGTPSHSLHGESGLGELVEDYLSRELQLYVYNHEYGCTRAVTITPSRNWGGSGALGCVLGYGALHRLPPPLEEPPAGPGETLFGAEEVQGPELPAPESSAAGGEFLVPAAMELPLPPSAPSPAPGRAARKPKVARGNSAFDDMFKEGEARSKEEDFVPSGKGSGAPPPPKRTGEGLPPPERSPAGTPQPEPEPDPDPDARKEPAV